MITEKHAWIAEAQTTRQKKHTRIAENHTTKQERHAWIGYFFTHFTHCLQQAIFHALHPILHPSPPPQAEQVSEGEGGEVIM